MKLYGLNGLEKTDLQVIQDTGWIDLNAYVKYRKVNGIVYVYGNSTNFNFSVGFNVVGTMPLWYRPLFDVYSNFTLIGHLDRGNIFNIYPSGEIGLYVGSAGIAGYGFAVSYPV